MEHRDIVRDRQPTSERIARSVLRALILSIGAALAGLMGCGGLPAVDDGAGGGTVVVMAVEEGTSAPLQVPVTIIVGGVRGELRPSDEQLILRGVPIGTGTPPTQPLTATAQGFVTRTQQVQMQVTAATWVTVELAKADPATTGSVGGTVRDADTGGPVVNAFVHFTPPGQDEGGVGGYTDAEGRFIIGGIPTGRRDVAVQAEGYLPSGTSTVTIRSDASGGNDDLQFELVAGDTTVNVRGVVVDALTRRAIAGAVVTFEDGEPVETDSDGRFRATDVRVGDRTVVAGAAGYDELTTVIRVLPGMGEITLELLEAAGDPPGAPFTLAGNVTLSGRPDNAGATVTALSLATGRVAATDETDAAGRYELFVAPGRYELTVTFGDREISREITVPEGGVIIDGVDFALTVG
ncbi:MAG: carboxypeptidase regulatory-like domain-containing protein [Armatimonadota bacterium]|jgi:hypothetical protein